jgi:hypothetical protein
MPCSLSVLHTLQPASAKHRVISKYLVEFDRLVMVVEQGWFLLSSVVSAGQQANLEESQKQVRRGIWQ